MRRARLTLAVLLTGAGLVACSDETACAAPTPTPALRMLPAPSKPTSRKDYRPPHQWGQNYRTPAVPPPTTIRHDCRTQGDTDD